MHRRRRTGPVAAWFAAVAALALTATLFSTPAAGRQPATPTAGARPAAVAQPGRQTSPFTGLPARIGPVLAAKIDNVAAARPHTGLQAADLVYVEQVEGGLSRLLAVLSSRLPSALGPVRSARESDIQLLRQFGRPALAYSGVQSGLNPTLQAAPLNLVNPTKAPRAFFRTSNRPAPFNLFVRPQQALNAAPGTSNAADIGFRFGSPPPGGTPTSSRTVSYPAARYTFTWNPGQKRWLISFDGSPATTTDNGRLGAPTVIIQHTTIRPSRFHDRSGAVSPFTQTIGSGTADVLRDGKTFPARWARPTPQAGTTYTTPTGARVNFARGPVWTLFVP